MGGVVFKYAAEAMSQFPGPPLNLRSPHKSPSWKTGAQLGGARWVALATRLQRVEWARSTGERCDRSPGAAGARRSPPRP